MRLKILFTVLIITISACSLYQTEGRKAIEKGDITLTKKSSKLFPHSEHCYKSTQLNMQNLDNILKSDNKAPLFQTNLEAYVIHLSSLDYRLVFLTERQDIFYLCDFYVRQNSSQSLSRTIEELESYSYQLFVDYFNRP